MSYKIYEIKSKKKDENSGTVCIRRFSDFDWLKQTLYKYHGFIVPFLPQKNILANFNLEN